MQAVALGPFGGLPYKDIKKLLCNETITEEAGYYKVCNTSFNHSNKWLVQDLGINYSCSAVFYWTGVSGFLFICLLLQM